MNQTCEEVDFKDRGVGGQFFIDILALAQPSQRASSSFVANDIFVLEEDTEECPGGGHILTTILIRKAPLSNSIL